ncbi:AMP deaminase, putative / myoadenylate deaminase [Wolffia australiana]
MDDYVLHMAMAALVGASIVAISAYSMHRKTLEQVLEYARRERSRRKVRNRGPDEDNFEEDENSELDCPSPPAKFDKREHRSQRSSALADVNLVNGSFNGDVDKVEDSKSLSFPPQLPRLQIHPEGNRQSRSASVSKRAEHGIRSISPRPPISSSLESIQGSADDNSPSDFKTEEIYIDPIQDSTSQADAFLQDLPDEAETEANSNTLSGANVIRSHTVSGDLHSVQPDPVTADILRKEPEHENYIKLKITPTETPSADETEVFMVLQECLKLRKAYVFTEQVTPWEKEVITDPSTPKPNPNPFVYTSEKKTDHHFQMEDGVVHVYANKNSKKKLFHVPDATEFFTDLHRLLRIIAAGNIRTVCHRRLVLLEQKFNMHHMLNSDAEFLAQKSAPHRDFYNVRKVDTHVHHSACMNQKHLLRFIKSKLRKEPDEVVIFRDGTYLTLREVFESLDLTGYDLNVDLLDVHADKSTFHRFDKFNLKYNPCGQSRLREIFLKQENLIQGRFLAEVTKEVFSDLAASKYQMAEYRLSIYGRKQSEWDQLASWIVNNDLYSPNVVWLIQLPRLYNVYKGMGIVTSFQNILDNVFLPLFEVTVNPDSHPQLHVFLKQVVGFDLVDDESKPERRPTKHMPTPAQWTNIFNPAFSYYAYYCYANLYTLNKLRESKGMTIIKFRPHAGEAGDIDHLAATFLAAHSIAHGIGLRKSPVLQYLYYLAQIGLAMSPLSNNSLFLDYHRNPFPVFFMRGLNVSLSTDDPLQIHLTKEPLVEEYSIAASVWKLSSTDICEIARNSVYQSGFSHALKSHWIGRAYYKRGPDGNDTHKTNVPHIRVEFRDMIWKEEMQLVFLGKAEIPEEIE